MKSRLKQLSIVVMGVVAAFLITITLTSMDVNNAEPVGAYLEISLNIKPENRESAVGVYLKYKAPFLKTIDGAQSKELLVRTEDVQVLHGFATEAQAQAYLKTSLFSKDIVGELGPLLAAPPEVKVYAVFK